MQPSMLRYSNRENRPTRSIPRSRASSTALATAPSVTATDAYGNPVSGATFTFAVTGGGGVVAPLTVSTNASGVATLTSWTLGATVGGGSEVSAKIEFTLPQTEMASALQRDCKSLEQDALKGLFLAGWLKRFTAEMNDPKIRGSGQKLKAITLVTSFEIGVKVGANLNPFFGATYILPISGLVGSWEPKVKHKLTIKINNTKAKSEDK